MNIADHAEQIARALLGHPNKHQSNSSQLRFGTHGSLALEIVGDKAGSWYDHESGEGGGLLDLIQRERGCDRDGALAWLKSELGIDFKPGGNGAAEPQRRGAAYIYKHERGEPRYCVSRWGPLKSFTQEKYDPVTEKFISGRGVMKGVALVPYRLDEWGAETGRVWIVEGEKDADRLAQLGVRSTTNPGGVGKWPAGFARYFVGRDAVVLPDNDKPGKTHARAVAASLKGVAASVVMLELPGLQPKQDVSDWLDQGHTLDDLEALLATGKPDGKIVADPDAGMDGAELLDGVLGFLRRFVAYPSEEAAAAHTLWIAHAHLMDAWESTPRIAFLSPEPASGKTRALEVTELLVPRPVEAVNVSPAYLFRKVGSEDGAPTILFDEIDTVFGPKAKDNEEIRGLLNAGHRRGAVAGRCVARGKLVETEEIPAYCAVALAGLGWLPDTLLTRSVIIRMRRRAPTESIEPYRRRVHAAQGMALRARLETWVGEVFGAASNAWPSMPVGIEDRDADVWEPLLTVADLAAGAWPDRARVSAVTLVSDLKESAPSLGVRLLEDLRAVFGDQDAMSSTDIIAALCGLDEAPWADMRGKPLNARGLATRLRPYGVKRKQIRIGDWVGKSYLRADLMDAWSRYLAPPSRQESVTSVTTVTAQPQAKATANSDVTDRVTDSGDVTDRIGDVTDCVTDCGPLKASKSAIVTDVTDLSEGRRAWDCQPDVVTLVEDLRDQGNSVGGIAHALGLTPTEVIAILRRTGR